MTDDRAGVATLRFQLSNGREGLWSLPHAQHDLPARVRRAGEHLVSKGCVFKREHGAHVGHELFRIEQLADFVEPRGRYIDYEVHRANAISLLQWRGNGRHRRNQNSPSLQNAERSLLRLTAHGIQDRTHASQGPLESL